MLGNAFEKGGHLPDLGRRLSIVAIEQEPQDELEVLERDDFGQRTNRPGVNAFVDQRRGRDSQLIFPRLQRRRTSRTGRPILAQVRA
jgi:hypothetical protein